MDFPQRHATHVTETASFKEYILTLWSVRGEHTQTLSVGDSPSDDNQLTLNVIFDTASFKAAPRTNKFGEAYKTKYSKREFF